MCSAKASISALLVKRVLVKDSSGAIEQPKKFTRCWGRFSKAKCPCGVRMTRPNVLTGAFSTKPLISRALPATSQGLLISTGRHSSFAVITVCGTGGGALSCAHDAALDKVAQD